MSRILDVGRDPLVYDAFQAGRSVARISGRAVVGGRTVAWSFIEKVTDGPGVASDYLYDNGAREFAAYRSGMLDDLAPGLVAPRVIGATQDTDGRLSLWLEDLTSGTRGPMGSADVLAAAHHIGRLGGRWLNRIPNHTWLFRGWIERHSQPAATADGIAVLERARGRSDIEARLGRRLDEAIDLIRRQPEYRTALEQLPPTLCHHDAVVANVFRRRRDGTTEVVLIDWESVGPGPIGADLASLLFSSARRGDLSARSLRTLMPDAVDAYADGIAAMGARLDRDWLRLGLLAAIALRWTLARDVVRVLLGTGVVRRGSAPHESPEEALDELIALTPILLDAAAEARVVIERLRHAPQPHHR